MKRELGFSPFVIGSPIVVDEVDLFSACGMRYLAAGLSVLIKDNLYAHTRVYAKALPQCLHLADSASQPGQAVR
jgi:hypothetical protein